jgi:AcrR family transcriptional regulator
MSLRLRKPAGRYHHGALKEALVSAAERHQARTGDMAFGLREVAGQAGVSHTAAYRHFASKTELLAAVAGRGFAGLTQRLERAAASAPGPAEGLVEAAVAYVEFALGESGAFRVMFSAELKPFTAHPGLAEAALEALAVLRGLVSRAEEAGVLPAGDAEARVRLLWTVAHGQASLATGAQLAGPFGLASDAAVLGDTRRMLQALVQAGLPG